MELEQIQATELSPPLESTIGSEDRGETDRRRLAREADLIKAGRGPINKWLGIPQRFHGKSLANLTGVADKIGAGKEALAVGKSIFITGGCGTGKTHLALGLLLWWSGVRWETPAFDNRVWRSVALTSWIELLLELKRGFGAGRSEAEMLEKYDKEMFVLDDLGAERISEWSRETCYALLDRRYRHVRQTIITSNLDLNGIAKTFDDRIASRIVEMAQVIELEGKDYRLKDFPQQTKKGKGKK